MHRRNALAAGLCLTALILGCSRGSDFSPGEPEAKGVASERTLRTDLERLYRDQVAHLVRYGAYAFTLRELDFRESDGVTITLRWISERSYYAVATSGTVECITAAWDVKSNLPEKGTALEMGSCRAPYPGGRLSLPGRTRRIIAAGPGRELPDPD
ncbi:MAG: hypothetical protein P8Y10_12500 [Gemmatimonadales bacterium]